MVQITNDDSHAQTAPFVAQDQASLTQGQLSLSGQTLATRAFQQLLTLASLPANEQKHAVQQIAVSQQWTPWFLGGFSFSDGSVLWHSGLDWQSLSADEAHTRLDQQPLEVRLHYAFQSGERRQKFTVTEARFSYQEATNCWRLVIQYEAYMNSPLYGFSANRFADLAELNIWSLRVDTRPHLRWQLEQIAAHPDWLELVLISSRPNRII